MRKRIKCAICGEEFEQKKYESICPKIHTYPCVVCGKDAIVRRAGVTNPLCSDKCREIYNKRKYKDDPNSRPGKYHKICCICGEEFNCNSDSRTICWKPHVKKCEICGKEFTYTYDEIDKRTCSYKCASEVRSRDLYKYKGVKSVFQLPEVQEKIKQTNLIKYGVENPLSSLEIREQIKQTCLDKYGVEYATQSDIMKQKSKQTNLEKYGVEHAMQNKEIQQRALNTTYERYGTDLADVIEARKKTCLEKYGTEWYVQSQDFKDKQSRTWEEKYGGNPWSTEEVRAKCNETNLERYGNIWPQCTEEVRRKQYETFVNHRAESIQDPATREEYLKFKYDPHKYIEDQIKADPLIDIESLSEKLGYADPSLIYYFFENSDLYLDSSLTYLEYQLVSFLRGLDENIKIDIHNRKIIFPKEIDVYLPEYHIGFECNPTITHNSSLSYEKVVKCSDSCKPLHYKYHLNKTEACEDANIFLFHIFGYEWKSRKDVIKSMICNLLGKNETKLYARKLHIKDVPYSDASEFLNNNHRQGSAVSTINLGLYTDQEELVSLMTFGKTRNTLGRTVKDNDEVYELVRFCNKQRTSVTGGASKLFKYFCKNNRFSKIISFSDRAHTRGNLYKILGFKEASRSAPNYVWANIFSEIYFNRVTCQKQNLRKLFDDPTIDIENKTEQQIMIEHNFVQVFDSGNIRWEYESL